MSVRILEPYIHRCTHEPGLTLLTSVLQTPTNWLLVRFLTETLPDASQGNTIPRGKGHNIVFVSIWRSYEFWTEIATKCRLNLQGAVAQGKLCYVNGLGDSLPSNVPATTMVNLKSFTLQDLSLAVNTALQKMLVSNTPDSTIVVIDGLDFLLACQPDLHSVDLVQYITGLQHQAHGLILTCNADSALLHNTDAAATPLELEHTIYARILAHQAHFVFQLRPLETGHSREVSGTIRISRGGGFEDPDDDAEELHEGEWLYHVKNDGSVNVWGRGETR